MLCLDFMKPYNRRVSTLAVEEYGLGEYPLFARTYLTLL